jgi:hypothetical protein
MDFSPPPSFSLQAVPGICKACPTHASVAALKGMVTYEHPNGSIYTFDGSLLPAGSHVDDALPLGPNNMVLRGCTLRNTGWILGLVVFSGVETKVGLCVCGGGGERGVWEGGGGLGGACRRLSLCVYVRARVRVGVCCGCGCVACQPLLCVECLRHVCCVRLPH